MKNMETNWAKINFLIKKQFSIAVKVSLMISLLLLGIIKKLNATTRHVSSINALQNAIDMSNNGDTVSMANGTYTNATINVNNNGVVIKADSLGGVIFNGNSVCNINSSNVVFLGFQFLYGNNGTNDVVNVYGNYNVIRQCNFNAITSHNYIHINSGAHHNEISYCNFEAKPPITNGGPMIQISTSSTTISYTKIRYCTFMNCLGSGGDNGNEPIRIGLSSEQNNTSATVIEYCYFENTGLGDSETISVKSQWNVLRYNTQQNNQRGSFVFRAGSNNTAYGNFFLSSGGIRIKEGQNHMVFNNYFNGGGSNPDLYLVNDSTNTIANILIYHNTFYKPTSILLGGSGNYRPSNVHMVNNIFQKSSGTILSDTNYLVNYAGNIFNGNATLGMNYNASEFTNINPKLNLNSEGYYSIASNSPAINNASANYPPIQTNPYVDIDPNILSDIAGFTRPTDKTQKDIGCNEFTTGTTINHPLVRCDAGPSYLCSTLPVNLISFNVVKRDISNELIWNTASEINTKNFEVQRAGKEQVFKTISIIAAKGSAAVYSFTDIQPPAISYYRLLQRDADGKIVFSKVVRVERALNGQFSIYPNPAKLTIYIQQNQTAQRLSSIVVTDASGRLYLQLNNPVAQNGIDISSWPNGIYFVKIIDSETRYITIQKVIKE